MVPEGLTELNTFAGFLSSYPFRTSVIHFLGLFLHACNPIAEFGKRWIQLRKLKSHWPMRHSSVIATKRPMVWVSTVKLEWKA